MKQFLLRWSPAIVLMASIFVLSSIPSQEMPSYGAWDTLVKKGGHMLGYGLLALAYGYGFRLERRKLTVAWLLAMLYAITDEFHQSFVPGRHASWVDVLLFDNVGAALLLFVAWYCSKKKAE